MWEGVSNLAYWSTGCLGFIPDTFSGFRDKWWMRGMSVLRSARLLQSIPGFKQRSNDILFIPGVEPVQGRLVKSEYFQREVNQY